MTIHSGDVVDVLPTLDVESIDACVTDPPYELAFMGKKWDGTGIAFQPATWAAVLRVLKPGAHLLAFGGTRTFHRMTCAIEDAGFEIRDCLSWLYGSGFPKSLNLGDGRGTALKPAWEPIILARKPLRGTVAATVAQYGTGALNVDVCRIGVGGQLKWSEPRDMGYHGGTDSNGVALDNPLGRWPANVVLDDEAAAMLGDVGGASRFFYVAKPSRDERDYGSARNIHPTVKPIELMRWLVRLITPLDGVVLDPFMGSGTTGMACRYELRRFVGIECEAEYVNIAERRIAAVAPLFGMDAARGQGE